MKWYVMCNTGTYWYILVCTCVIVVCTSIWISILVYTVTYWVYICSVQDNSVDHCINKYKQVQTSMYIYIPVYTCVYRYILVYTLIHWYVNEEVIVTVLWGTWLLQRRFHLIWSKVWYILVCTGIYYAVLIYTSMCINEHSIS